MITVTPAEVSKKIQYNMTKKLFMDMLGWGILLWIAGYILGIILFMVVPVGLIGWIISPFGILLTLWVLMKKIKSTYLLYYLAVAIVWTAIAVLLDYFFLVRLFHPADGYYKIDVYLYYFLTFILPLLVGFFRYNR